MKTEYWGLYCPTCKRWLTTMDGKILIYPAKAIADEHRKQEPHTSGHELHVTQLVSEPEDPVEFKVS